MAARYRGRFAPSPTGALHAGSLVAALASWLDARAHGGQWLVRIEDVDGPRCVPGADTHMLAQLAACGLQPDEPPVWQSQRGGLYQSALERLLAAGQAYPCGCTRRNIALALAAAGHTKARHGELAYPGTCRNGLHGKAARAVRLRTSMANGGDVHIDWRDRRLGDQTQNVTQAVGDYVLHRADGLWAYQLAVVVDDAAQAITHVVRGEDLADNTARQILLQQQLGLPAPNYLHTPLVVNEQGEKLSKQTGAQALNVDRPLDALREAGRTLGLPALDAQTIAPWLTAATAAWRDRWGAVA